MDAHLKHKEFRSGIQKQKAVTNESKKNTGAENHFAMQNTTLIAYLEDKGFANNMLVLVNPSSHDDVCGKSEQRRQYKQN